MKKDGMMMRLKEERRDSRSVIKTSCLFFSFLIFSSVSFAQLNLNGFVEVRQFQTDSSANRLVSAFIDSDDKPDFILIKAEKKLSLHLSSDNYNHKLISINYRISSLKKIKKISSTEIIFAFVSRKDKVLGIFTINDTGKLLSLKTIRLDESPDDFVLSKNGSKAIVFGSNFRGLALVDLELKTSPLHFAKNALIKSALFYDLDNDLNTDIVYYDIFTGTINLIKNENNYELVEINLNLQINNLTKLYRTDFDYDGFDDIIFNSEKGIEVFPGDSITTFERRELLLKDNEIQDFQIGDFNKDGYNDVVYLKIDKQNGSRLYLSLSTAGELSKPILISGAQSITTLDVAGWGKDKLVFLAEDGTVSILSSLSDIEGSSLKLGVNPVSIFSFEREGSRLLNLAVVDSADSKLKIYLDALGLYYEILLKALYNNLQAVNVSDTEIAFVLFTGGDKLFEIAKLNIATGGVWAKQFYAQYKIIDIKLQRRNGALPTVLVYSHSDGKKFIEYFEYKNFRYQKSEPKFISLDSEVNLYSETKSFNYVNRDSTIIVFSDSGELFLQRINPVTKQRTISKLDIEVNGPLAVEFVNKKNGYIFMLNKERNLIEVSSIE